MSVYALWANGEPLATYKTLGQALLGATWRSRKSGHAVGIYTRTKTGGERCVATVRAD